MQRLTRTILCLLVIIQSTYFSSRAARADQSGLPLGVIFDNSVPQETFEIVNSVIQSLNSNNKYQRHKWSIHVSKIDTDNTQALIGTICGYMSRGVLAVFGSTNMSSFNTVRFLTNKYNIPYMSWSYFYKDQSSLNTRLDDLATRLKRSSKEGIMDISIKDLTDVEETPEEMLISRAKRNVNFNPSGRDYEYLYGGEYDSKDMYNIGIEYLKNMKREVVNDEKQLYLEPNLGRALTELVKFYQWPSVYYIYNHDKGKINLESLIDHQLENQKHSVKNALKNIMVRKLVQVKKIREMLRVINSMTPTLTNVTLIIDLDSPESYKYVLNQMKDLGMTDNRYIFILVYPSINEINVNDFKYGGVTIFGFSTVDYYNLNTIKIISDLIEKDRALNEINVIPNEAATLIDGLTYFLWKIDSIVGPDLKRLFGMDGAELHNNQIYINMKKGVRCNMGLNSTEKWQLGSFILNQIKMADTQVFEGLTGPVAFDANGNRKNYKIGIYNLEMNSRLSKIGLYSSELGLRISDKKKVSKAVSTNLSGKKKVIISVMDEPFFMLRKPEAGKNFTGNDRYMGYCVDLTKKIAEMLNFEYEIRPVMDKKFGKQDSEGRWDGMVGELVRNEADAAVAPLTISTQRERAVEFSMPFMNIGISIMISKPKKEKPGVFSFMTPLDKGVWVCTITGYLVVSMVMYLICRFSPYEWHTDSEGNMTNDFSLRNTLWFNLAALLQQGADFSPKSASARLIAGVWWFFTLILISSYTANLAAFLTVENMVNPIDSPEDLVKQSEIKFGVMADGSTSAFFKLMWRFMNSWGPSVFVKSNFEGVQKVRNSSGKYAFLLESSVNEYLNERKPCNTIKVGNNLDSKGYGVATPIGSQLSEPINLAILQLSEDGFLAELKSKWWYDRSECGGVVSGSDSNKTPLNLVNVAGVFYILIIGLILSVVIASTELIYKAHAHSKKDNIQLSNAIKSRIRMSISGFDNHPANAEKANMNLLCEIKNSNNTTLSRYAVDSSKVAAKKNSRETKSLLL